jgi:hypothetical protein
MVNCVEAPSAVCSEVRIPVSMGRGRTEKISREANDFTLARKAAIECLWYPYRKPTQVGWERILRRTGESLLRNSAK